MWPRQATNDNKIQHLYFAFQITKAIDSHSEYVILIAPAGMEKQYEHASMLGLHTYAKSCLYLLSN